MLQDTFYDAAQLTGFYESNGLLAKIVDMPAEDAAFTGFTLAGISPTVAAYYMDALDRLGWENVAADAIRWQRLFGGSIIIPIVDDGRGLQDPLDLNRVRSVDGLVVYSAAVVKPHFDPQTGEAVHFTVQTDQGSCILHASRALVFKSDPVPPEQAADDVTAFWGIPLFYRVRDALQHVVLSSAAPARILGTMGQSVLKLQGLSEILSTAEGEAALVERLAFMDAVRGLFSTMAVDITEDYQTAPTPHALTEVSALVNSAWTVLSSASGIPARILAGGTVLDSGGAVRAPYKKTADETSPKQYKDFILQIQTATIKPPLLRLLHILTQAGLASGELTRAYPIHIQFRPLFPPSPLEKVENELKKAEIELIRARILQAQLAAGILSREEVLALIKRSRRNKTQS